MLKKVFTTALLTLGLCVPALSGAAPTELSVTSSWYERHPGYVDYWTPWMKMIEDKTEGRVKPYYYSPNTLINEKEVWSGVVNGTLGFTWGMTAKTPGKFPLNSLPELPLIVPTVRIGGHILWDLHNQFPEWKNEFRDAKMLGQFTNPPWQIFTTKKPIKTLADLKGLKIITFTSITADIFKALGANPINVLPTEVYLALERGMADGVVNTLVAARSEKNTEVAKYLTLVGINSGSFFVAMNKDVWAALDPKDQALFEANGGGKLADELGGVMDSKAVEQLELMKKEGVTVYQLPPDELQRWTEALQPLYAKWVNDMKEEGVANAQQILDKAFELRDKYVKEIGK